MKLIAFVLFAAALSAQELEWRQLESSGAKPSPRFDGTIAFAAQDRKLYLFGGTDDSGDLNDLWAYDFASSRWSKLAPNGSLPSARHGHTLNYDARRNQLLVVAGQAGSLFGDVWAYDLARNVWTQFSAGGGPSARYGHSVVLDARRDRLVLSHGFTSERGRFDDTWAFDLNARRWTNITPAGTKPLRRCLHHAVISAARDEMYLYGGCSSGAGPCPQGDLWIFHLARQEWREAALGNRPPGRQWYGMSFDDARQRLVLFGGAGNGQLGDAWEFDPARESWSALDAAGAKPSARQRLQGAYAEGYGNLFFGGIVAQNSNELWNLGKATLAVRGVFDGSPGPFAANEIVSVYGVGLSGEVEVERVAARVFYSSPGQMNLLLPAELAGRQSARLRVGGVEAEIALREAAPKFYSGLIRVEDVLVLYGTGGGVRVGTASARVNGEAAEVLYAGEAPGFVGLEQYNLRIPAAQLRAERFEVRIEVGEGVGTIVLGAQ